MLLCVFKTGAQQIKRLGQKLKSGGVKGFIPGVARSMESAIRSVLGGAKRTFTFAADRYSSGSAPETSVEKFRRSVDQAMIRIGKVMPMVTCFREVVGGLLRVATAPIAKVTKKLDDFFISFMTETAPKVVGSLFKSMVKTLLEKMYGDGAVERAKEAVARGIQKLANAKEKAVTEMFKRINAMQPGALRTELTKTLNNLLSRKLDLKMILNSAIFVIEDFIVRAVVHGLQKVISPAFDALMDASGTMLMNIATAGINTALSTGSVISEWISSGILNIVQSQWETAKEKGKSAIYSALRPLMSKVVNGMMKKALNNPKLKSVKEHVMQPIDKKARPMIQKIAAESKQVAHTLSGGDHALFRKFLKNLFLEVMKGALPTAKRNDGVDAALAKMVKPSAL